MRFAAFRVLYGAVAGLCIGVLTGAGEVTYLTYSDLKVLMTPAQWSALFGVAVLTYGGLSAGIGAVVAGVLAPVLGRGAKVDYYRSAMNRDLLASTLAPAIGVCLAAMGWIVVSPTVLAALRTEGGKTWGLAVSGFVLVRRG